MKNKIILLSLIVSCFFLGCEKDYDFLDENHNSPDSSKSKVSYNKSGEEPIEESEGMVVLGNQLTNPYTVSNMQTAFQNLVNSGRFTGGEFSIVKTHEYIKFTPTDDVELAILQDDQTHEYYSYPLDYEILSEGAVYYHDPEISESEPTYQYATYAVGDELPNNITSEVLADLFIPELVTTAAEADIFDLVNEALTITGNDLGLDEESEEEGPQPEGPFSCNKWRPRGTIQVYDDVAGYVAVKGARVRARRWFTTHTGLTNASGYYQTSRFCRKVNYSIIWERPGYDIRDGLHFQAIYNGPKKKGDWNLNISSNKSLRFATIHRAAYRYFFDNIGGLNRPTGRRLKLAYRHQSGPVGGRFQYWSNFVPVYSLFAPQIRIYKKKSGSATDRSTDDIFSTTAHEIGHASHAYMMQFGIASFHFVEDFIQESWAASIDWYIAGLEYSSLGHPNYNGFGHDGNNYYYGHAHKQGFTFGGNEYTPIFIDMFDALNQSTQAPANPPTPRCNQQNYNFGSNECFYHNIAPNGTTPFIYADNFYYTPVNGNQCPMVGSNFDGANCFVAPIPSDRIGSLDFAFYGNGWKTSASGDPSIPYDEITGFTMGDLENQVIKNSKNKSELIQKLKQYKPSPMTDKHIDLYFNFYQNGNFSWYK